MSTMKGHARNLMSEKVFAVGNDTPLGEIGRLLVMESVSGVPVLDGDERVIGFVSETDVLAALLRGEPEELLARDVMSHPPIVADEFMATDDVLGLLRQAHIHHLPVVRDGRLVGIITPHDILRYYVERMLPPMPERA
jgi:CBS domain-containing protein